METVIRLEFEIYFCLLLVVWPKARQLISLDIMFLICEVAIMIATFLWGQQDPVE